MEGCLFTLLGLVVLAFFAGPWVLLALQHRRQREQDATLVELRNELGKLSARLDRGLRAASAGGGAVATVAEQPVPAIGEEASFAAAGAAAPPAPAPPPAITAPLDAPAAARIAIEPRVEVAPIAAAASIGAAEVVAASAFGGAAAGTADSIPIPPSSPPRGAPPPPPAAPPSGVGASPPGAAAPPGDSGPHLPAIDWERWIGVRGAAVLGGIVLALAGILFVRYSIEHGLISPALRVTMGILAGLASITGSEWLRKRGYRVNADALAGAGIVLLYAALWAAHSLYGFVGPGVAYALMSLITVACGVLSWRNASLLIAVLGLTGGFATPFLIATKTDNPIGLFGYVLLLDLGLIALARRRGWSALTVLALVGTVFYQSFWILTRMDSDGEFLGLAIVGLFALVFALAGYGRGERGADGVSSEPAAIASAGWFLAQAAGLLVPFAFALYIASRADLPPALHPIALLLLMLSLAAQWIARRTPGADVLASGAAAGSIAVVLVWSWDIKLTPFLTWELIATCVVLAAAFHLFAELDVRARRPARVSALVAETGFLVVLILNWFAVHDSPWPWVLGLVLIAALLLRLSIDPERAFTPLIAASGVACGMTGWFLIAARAATLPPPEIYFGAVLLLGAAFSAQALLRASGPARRASDVAAAVYPAIVLVGLLSDAPQESLEAPMVLAVSMLLGLLIVLATTRLESGGGYLAGMLLLAVVHTVWSRTDTAREHALMWLIVGLVAVVSFAVWPSLAPRLGRSRVAWRAASLAGPAWFLSTHKAFVERFGDRAIGLLPLVLAAITLGAAYRGRRAWTSDDPTASNANLAWFGAVVLGLAAIAVPLQLEKEWITVGWALEGLAVTALWKRLDQPGLKYFAAALLAAVTARLLMNPEVLSYHERTGMPVLNWLAYTYLVPAACLLGVRFILARAVEVEAPGTGIEDAGGETPASSALALEVARARPWEGVLYSRRLPVFAGAAAVAAIFVVFAWINLTIFDAFSSGPMLSLSLERLPARDLTLSLAWVVYAVALLGIGMARDSSALRWLSLGFLVLSIGKVFLHDLGELHDLYRVASLVGLAISLILVSLAYQRFVFRRRAAPDAA
jgi:hypothetical protein